MVRASKPMAVLKDLKAKNLALFHERYGPISLISDIYTVLRNNQLDHVKEINKNKKEKYSIPPLMDDTAGRPKLNFVAPKPDGE